MKICCSRQELIKSVNIALRAVPVRTTMPILECILIDARQGDIHFISNDMERSGDVIVYGTCEIATPKRYIVIVVNFIHQAETIQ